MLLNLSNHPFDTWSETQRKAALEQYGGVEDMAFPEVSPESDMDEIRQLAEEYEIQVRKQNPHVVHLMGEQTFCHALINRLQSAGIPCVASTTRRNVRQLPTGEIIKTFEFVRFRGYP